MVGHYFALVSATLSLTSRGGDLDGELAVGTGLAGYSCASVFAALSLASTLLVFIGAIISLAWRWCFAVAASDFNSQTRTVCIPSASAGKLVSSSEPLRLRSSMLQMCACAAVLMCAALAIIWLVPYVKKLSCQKRGRHFRVWLRMELLLAQVAELLVERRGLLDAVLFSRAWDRSLPALAGFLLRTQGYHCKNAFLCRALSAGLLLATSDYSSCGFILVALAFVKPIFPPASGDTRPLPFKNAGASCYISATLQALFGIEEVRADCRDLSEHCSHQLQQRLRSMDHKRQETLDLPDMMLEDGRLDGDQLLALTWLACTRLMSASLHFIFPHLFLRSCFYDGGHADPHEFLKGVLDGASCGAPRISVAFRGIQTTCIQCPSCSVEKIVGSLDHFTSLEVDVHDGDAALLTLPSCLEAHFKGRPVDSSYQWRGCLACGERSGRPTTKLQLTYKPPVLCIMLKRWVEQAAYRTHNVHLPDELMLDGVTYSFSGVVVYQGDRRGKFGHYWAVVPHGVGTARKFYTYNDNRRWEASEEAWQNPRNGHVYLVMYRRGLNSF